MMNRSVTSSDDHLKFIRVSTPTVLNIPIDNRFHHQSDTPLCSKKGWLLVKKDLNSLFLLNPITKEKISLPEIAVLNRYTFSVVDGRPKFVLLANLYRRGDQEKVLILRRWRPGDNSWTIIGHFSTNLHFNKSRLTLCVAGESIYCVDETGWVIIYDMKRMDWVKKGMEIPSNYDENIRLMTKIAEYDDKEIRRLDISCCDLLTNVTKRKYIMDFTLYRLNEEKMQWEILSETDIKDTSWCIGCTLSPVLAKGEPRIYIVRYGHLYFSDIHKPTQRGTPMRHLFTRRNNPIPHHYSGCKNNQHVWFDV